MSTVTAARRAAGLAALLGAAGLLVGGKLATAAGGAQPVVLAGPAAGSVTAPVTAPPGAPAPATGRTAAPGGPAGSGARPSSRSRPTATALPTRSVLGRAEDVSYGTVQVRVTLHGSRVVDVTAVQLPSGGRSSDIAAYAAPRLRAEVLTAQSAQIDVVSGASYTSDGYARSVQSALDAARP